MNLIREDYLKLIRPYYDVDLIKLISNLNIIDFLLHKVSLHLS